MDRNRPISILDDSPDPEPRDSWSRIRETVAADEATKHSRIKLSQVLWILCAIMCLAIGVGAGYYVVRNYDILGVIESAGWFSGTTPAKTETVEVQKPRDKRVVSRHAKKQSQEAVNSGPVYNVEVVDNKTQDDPYTAVAKDSRGRVYAVKPAPLPALVIPHALPTSTPAFGIAKPALPSPAVKALSLDQYRNLNGSVTLRASVGNDGALKEYAILDGPADLLQPAVDVARGQRYDPPRKNYSARWTTIVVSFKK